MDTAELRKMIAGQEAQDQNDDGFRISTKGRVVTIEIMMAIDGGDCEYVEFNLPLEVCKPAFDQLLPLHEDNPDSNLDFDEDEIRDQTMAAGPCNCGRDGCDDCRALKEGRDVGVKLINKNGKPWFSVTATAAAPGLDFEFPDWSGRKRDLQDLINGNDCEYELDNGYDIIVENEVVYIGAAPHDEDNDPPSWKLSHDRCQEAFEAVAKFYSK